MPCSSSVIDESGNVFRIEGLYDLNCNKTRIFGYIEKFIIWRVLWKTQKLSRFSEK
jgi:hypothetical protein